MPIDGVLQRAVGGGRLERDELLELYEHANLLSLGDAADRVRQRMHPDRVVTYVVDRNINYTNVCVSRCRFCAFYRDEGHPEAYVLGFDTIAEKIRALCDAGGTQVLMQGGLHPSLTIEYFEHLLRFIKQRFAVQLHSLSPPEIVHIAGVSGLNTADTLRRLRDAGLDSLPGGGAEVLSDRVRQAVSPAKCSAGEWHTVMEQAHALGMPTTATMMFGHGDSPADRVDHLLAVRALQDRTGGFTAFIPWTFQPANTAMAHRPTLGGHEYLRTLAISRLALDNVRNIQASWVTQGAKVAQLALRFGANDMGSTMMEENVVRAAGVSFRLDRRGISSLITAAGFAARQRDTRYRRIGG
ncbi:MAG TPA: cyclic dehypoxanthinyl futalosine synthase [Armatimonadota bacterium]|nr:cyclic dehypoxanthinyl futalosine synthase [Armatimonadota bacterium]